MAPGESPRSRAGARYANLTLFDLRNNLGGTRKVYEVFEMNQVGTMLGFPEFIEGQ